MHAMCSALSFISLAGNTNHEAHPSVIFASVLLLLVSSDNKCIFGLFTIFLYPLFSAKFKLHFANSLSVDFKQLEV
jgi:hypothetical protein